MDRLLPHDGHAGVPQRRVRGWSRRSLLSTLVAVPTLVTLVACSGGAPAAPVQPNVTQVATQAAAAATLVASPMATAQAAASPAMATAQAAASPAMATAQAAVTGSPGARPSPSPAAMGGGTVRIADASLADSTPWLSIRNDGSEPIDVSGWQLQVGMVTADIPESAAVEAGGTLTLHAGPGLSSEDEVYLGNAGDALVAAAQPGVPVRLADDTGRVVSEVTVPRF